MFRRFSFLFAMTFTCIQSYAIEFNGANIAVANLFKSNDIVFIGENHGIEESRDFIISILEVGLQSGLISSFSTEYILSQENSIFNSYLKDSDVNPGSKKEKEYFEIFQKNGLLWLTNPNTLIFLRRLRLLKVKYPKFQVCGVDERAAINVRDGRTETVIRNERYRGFPLDIQAALIKLTGKNLVELVNDKRWYDREVLYL